jgi:HlyD family secretion protein
LCAVRKRQILGLSIGGLLLVIAFARLCFGSPAIPVRIAQVERARVEATIANSKAGSVRARRRAKLSPEAAGRVVEVPRREGDRVERGDVIVVLNDASQRAELLHAERSLTAAKAALEESRLAHSLALRDLERTRELAAKDIVSAELMDRVQTEHDQAQAAYAARRAEVAKAGAAIAVARAEVAKAVIRAPFDGVLAELDVQLGEWITSESPYIAIVPSIDIIDPSSLYVSAPMDEVDGARIQVGQRAKVSVDSHPGQRFPGRVVRVAPYVLDVEAQNRTLEVEVELDDEQFSATLLPGTSADVEVVLDVRDDVPRIPTSALIAGERVLVVRDGRLVEQSVEIGLKNWDHAEVLSGLEPGQQVVVSLDREGVRSGARVVVETPARP